MKKLFSGIGILLAIFSIYFFLLVADKAVYVNEDHIYDFLLEGNSITVEQLETIAAESDTMIQIRSYEAISFGNSKINILILHPDATIKEGIQPNVLPGNKINYQLNGYDEKTQVQLFTIQETERGKVEQVEKMLQEMNCNYDLMEDEPIEFTFSMLFSELNAKFFILLLILSFLCIVTYYIYRLKEIGILKLNGWQDWKISVRIMWTMFRNTCLSSLVLMGTASIYTAIMDISKLPMYLYMCMLLLCFALLVYVLAAVIAIVFIKNVNQISAIKNGRNNKFIFYGLVFVKIITTGLLLVSFQQLSSNAQLARTGIEVAKELKAYDFYTINTSVTPTSEDMEQLDAFLATLSNQEVYNYASSDMLYSYAEVREKASKEYSLDNIDSNTIELSENLLSILKVRDTQGKLIEKVDLGKEEEIVLVPEHLKENANEVLTYLGFDKNTRVYFIQDGQIYQDLLWPGKYAYDSILWVHGVEKQLYLNAGEMLYQKEAVSKIKNKLNQLQIDEGSTQVVSRNGEIDTMIANYEIDAWESGFFLLINCISYALSAIAIITIYFEFRKKQFGVYTLLGKIPWKDIMFLAVINIVTVSVLAALIDIRYIVFVLFELVVYLVSVRRYIRRKAITAIKGE